MNNYTSENISAFIDFINDSIEVYHEAIQDLSDADRKIQDLLHFIELEKADACTMSRVYKKLKLTRIKRRCLKNTIELLQPLVRWHDKHGSSLVPLNKNVLPAVQAVEALQEKREYYIKSDILNDLTTKSRFKERNGIG